MINPRLEKHFQLYASFHRHPTNQLTHKIAIPLIVFHIMAMLDWVNVFTINGITITLAYVGYVFAMIFYFSLDFSLAVAMAILFGLCIPLGRITPVWVIIGTAVSGWIIQLAGHSVWEKNRPAFLVNLYQTLIGPLFFVAMFFKRWQKTGPA